MKTHTVSLDVKDPDAFGELIGELDIDRRVYDKFLEFCEYATIELDVAADFTVTAARFVPKKRAR